MNKKMLKVLGAGGLALFMGLGTLCGVLLAPMSGSAAATMTSQDNSTTNLSAEAQAKAELDANILAGGGLGLDPENDPVIYTTETGIDIKFHQVGTMGSGGLKGYPYVTMGTYQSAAVNWIIIGQNVRSLFVSDTSPAANAIYTDVEKGKTCYINTNSAGPSPIQYYTNVVKNTSELSSGEILLISQYPFNFSFFQDGSNGTYYEGSKLQSTILAYYNSGLGLTTAQKNLIVGKNLVQFAYDKTTSSSNQKMFTLATKTTRYGSHPTLVASQNFCIETYLSTDALRVAEKHPNLSANYAAYLQTYWTRTGFESGTAAGSSYAYYISETGAISSRAGRESYSNYPNGIVAVRPCFVMKCK